MLTTEATLAKTPALISVRRAQKSDVFALAALVEELAIHHGDQSTNNAAKLDRDLFSEQPWAFAFVAETGGEMIGYALLYPVYRATEGERGMELHQLFVKEGHRGEGIGRHLIERAKAHARVAGCDFLTVAAATSNYKAYRYYEGQNFTPYPSTGMRFRAKL